MRFLPFALGLVALSPLSWLSQCTGGGRPAFTAGNLRCEHRLEPRGLGELRPRLDWTLTAVDPAARGLGQSAYQVLVASSAAELAADHGDWWDSGKVASNRTHDVVYAGHGLDSRQACWWKVRVWDQAGRVSAWSPPARWTLGLLRPSDWSAQWIGFDAAEPAEPAALTPAERARIEQLSWATAPGAASVALPLTRYFRGSFAWPAERSLVRARLILVPDQEADITVNGRDVGQTARWERARAFDLTPFLTGGENVVGLRLSQADGYPPAALGEITLEFAAGEPQHVAIDGTWRAAAAAPAGWDRPGFDAGAWAPVTVLPEHKSSWKTPQNATHFLPPVPLLRKTFSVDPSVKRAVLYVSALGLYEVHLNGRRIGTDYFTPGWTDYRYRVPAQAYDVTSRLQPGTNALGAMLGEGWFAGTASFTGKHRLLGAYARFLAQLEIDYADGRRQTVGTDDSWRAAAGPVRYADLFQGCATDLRRVRPGWSLPHFDDSAWSAVAVGLRLTGSDSAMANAKFIVAPDAIDPVRVEREVAAKRVTETAPGTYLVDFGQNLVGWVRWRAQGLSGQKITVRHGEMLNPNGTLYTSNLRGAAATDVYWLRGGREEKLEPVFTFHGFRYAEVRGLTAPPALEDAVAVVVHSALTRTGDFSSSDPRLNQLFHNIIWGQKGNYLEAPTDCPQRDERLGWTGDTQFFLRTGAFNYDVESFIERWLTTLITDEQGDDGTFPDVAPSMLRPATAITAWGDAAIVCTHALWQIYGDTRIVERHFDSLARYIGWLQAHAKDGILHVGGYEDWVNLGGGAKTEVIDTAVYAQLCGMMAEMARAIGRPAYAEFYAALQREETGAWRQAFLQPDGGILESSQTGYALAFTADLLPADLKPAAAAKFVGEIASRDWHLATGFIGTPRLLPALHNAGRDDVAYRLLLQDTYPSWLFQVKLGATTMWERWDGWTPDRGFQTINMNSFNHYAFGSVGEYLYRVVAGIDTAGTGFAHILIEPQPGGGLTEGRASYDAITGRIVSGWRIEGGKFILDVAIPPNTTATVRVPTSDPTAVR